MKEINHILYASDLGKGSREVFRVALQEMLKHEAKITFFHSVEPLNELTSDIFEGYVSDEVETTHTEVILQEHRKRIEIRIKRFLADEMENCKDDFVMPGIEVSVGHTDDEIIKAAKALKVDMIVMGARSGSKLARFFLGSTVQKVLGKSKIPVLVVPVSIPYSED